MRRSSFAGYHPVVQVIYFTAVITLTMLIWQPVVLVISLASAAVCAGITGGRRALRTALALVLPASLLFLVINPLFSHRGATILFYLPDGNPFTLESAVYAAAASCIFASVMLWCMSLRYCVTSDKVIYLFGRVSPRLALLISMSLRFIPLYIREFRQVTAAHRCMGRDISRGGLIKRTRTLAGILSCVTGRALEGSVMTADSMKSRGASLSGRSSYHDYHFRARDIIMLVIMLISGGGVLFGLISGRLEFWYYPAVEEPQFTAADMMIYTAAAVLYALPVILQIKETIKWSLALRAVPVQPCPQKKK